MQESFSNSLIISISESRFGPYQRADNSNYGPFARYLWNIALGESLYSTIQGLEVTLRNGIHNVATRSFGRSDWFNSILVAQEIRILNIADIRLKQSGKSPNSEDLVAALPLGFWVNLFYSRYEQKLWPRILKDVFPYIPARLRRRDYISRRLNPIRHLRNRVFHHEPVWHWPDLERHHDNSLEVIGWINPDMLNLVKLVDRFPEVYGRGPESYRDALLELGRSGV